MKSQLTKCADEFLGYLDAATRADVRVQCRVMDKSVSLTFPSAVTAYEALVLLRPKVVRWLDRASSESRILRIKPDRTVDQRCLLRLMGELWAEVESYFNSKSLMQEGWKVGTTGIDGCVFLITGPDDAVELFTVARTSGGALQVQLGEGIATVGLTADAAQIMIDTAMAAVRREENEMEL